MEKELGIISLVSATLGSVVVLLLYSPILGVILLLSAIVRALVVSNGLVYLTTCYIWTNCFFAFNSPLFILLLVLDGVTMLSLAEAVRTEAEYGTIN